MGWRRELAPGHVFACLFQVQRAFHHIFGSIIGRSSAAARLRGSVWQSIFTHDMGRYLHALYGDMADVTTLVIGPSGTGKELAARAIHNLGDRSDMPFVVVNCGAIAPNLYESEFFGYRKGAFTGALNDREGLLDAARDGILFLDEVGEIPLNLQVKLLRALDGGGYLRVGDTTERQSDFRLIVATNSLSKEDVEDRVKKAGAAYVSKDQPPTQIAALVQRTLGAA